MVDADQATRLQWLTQVAEGLAYAHDQGIVHRDAKPENVVITKDGIAKVTDFGIAKALRPERGREDTTYSVAGTPRYMAPEQVIGQRVDGRADQFAWAVMGYELLGGGATPSKASDERPVDSAATKTSTVPTQVRRILARAIANQANDRYTDFHTLLSDMRSSGRRRAWSRLGGRLAIALMAMATGCFLVTHRPTPRAEHPTPAIAQFDAAKLDVEAVARCADAARPDFASALQLWRDASQYEAVPRFDAATKADPNCAAASVYYLVAAPQNFAGRREHFRHARHLRTKLESRERQLLDALEPSLWEPPDFEEVSRRAKRLVESAPLDLDFRRLYARALNRAGRFDEALSVVEEAIARQTLLVPNLEYVAASVQMARGKLDAAHERFARCLQASPDSEDCLALDSAILASRGECSRAEEQLRHLTAVMPQSETGYLDLGIELLGSTNDASAARSAFEARWRNWVEGFSISPTRDVARLSDEARMAIVSGDLNGGLGFLRAWNSATATMNSARARGEVLLELVSLLQELNYGEEARTLARKALREHVAWGSDEVLDVDIELPRLAYLVGAIGPDEYRELREEWIRRSRRPPGEIWLAGFAGLPEVGADIAPNLTGQYQQPWIIAYPEMFSRAAQELSRLGRVTEAVSYAEAAAKSCVAYSGMGYIYRKRVVAEMHELAHDMPGACRDYIFLQNLLQKNARSVTLHFAERRVKKLSCKDDGIKDPSTRTRSNHAEWSHDP